MKTLSAGIGGYLDMMRLSLVSIFSFSFFSLSDPAQASICEIIAKHGIYDFINENYEHSVHSEIRKRVCSNQKVVESGTLDLAGIYNGTYLSISGDSQKLNLNSFCSTDKAVFDESIKKFTNNKVLNPKALDLLKNCIPAEDKPKMQFEVLDNGHYLVKTLYPKYPGVDTTYEYLMTIQDSTCSDGSKWPPDGKKTDFTVGQPNRPDFKISPAEKIILNCKFADQTYETLINTEVTPQSRQRNTTSGGRPLWGEKTRLYFFQKSPLDEIIDNATNNAQLFNDYCTGNIGASGQLRDVPSPGIFYASKDGFRPSTANNSTWERFSKHITIPGAPFLAFAVRTSKFAQAWFLIRPSHNGSGASPVCSFTEGIN